MAYRNPVFVPSAHSTPAWTWPGELVPEHHPGGVSYGADTAEAAEAAEVAAEETDYMAYLEAMAPTLSQIVFGSSPREEAATLTARIQNYQSLKEKTGSKMLRNYYAMQINKMKAKLVALQEMAQEERLTSTLSVATRVILVGGGILGLFLLVQGSRVLGAKKRQIERG